MAEPINWREPAEGGKIPGTGYSGMFHNVYHAGDYWFSVARTDSTDMTVRYATDPSGSWGTATLPGWPTGTTIVEPMDANGVQYDGTHYAFGVNVGGTAGARIYYATDPSGTWSQHDFGAGTTYDAQTLLYDGSRWIIGGRYAGATPNPGFIGYTGAGSAVTSTYTFGTAVGYDPAGLTSWTVNALQFDGTHYLASAFRVPTTSLNGYLRYATDITTTSWGTPTTGQIEQVNQLQYNADVDYWYSVGPNPTTYYAQDPTATWGSVTSSSHLMADEALGLDYGDGYWVIGGRYSSPGQLPAMAYLQATSPSGSYTLIPAGGHGFGSDSSQLILGVKYHDGYWVAAANLDAELRWCRTSGSSTLRQRQSPLRTPARVRGADLRQRQTPYIR